MAGRSNVKKEDVVIIDDPKRPQGFSLIELLTVMTIIAITSAITIPLGIDYVRNYEVIGAAQSVASQMQAARGQAVRRNSRRGIILNFDYPAVANYQYTSLDEDPWNANWDGCVYPANPGVFDPSSRNYGTAPPPPLCNVQTPGHNLPSPHGEVISLPTEMEFVDGQTFSSLLFRVNGSVEAVNVDNVTGQTVTANGLNWEVQIRHPRHGLARTISISRHGRVAVTIPTTP
jgi:prepilin-type N-terminal cleavage/methylation domain-containing protein